jgi:hypothetical protein
MIQDFCMSAVVASGGYLNTWKKMVDGFGSCLNSHLIILPILFYPLEFIKY